MKGRSWSSGSAAREQKARRSRMDASTLFLEPTVPDRIEAAPASSITARNARDAMREAVEVFLTSKRVPLDEVEVLVGLEHGRVIVAAMSRTLRAYGAMHGVDV